MDNWRWDLNGKKCKTEKLFISKVSIEFDRVKYRVIETDGNDKIKNI